MEHRSARHWFVALTATLVGLAGAVIATWVHFKALTDPYYVSAIDLSASINCTIPFLSRFSAPLGIPLSTLSLAWFALALVVLTVDNADLKTAAHAYSHVVCGAAVGALAYALYASFRLGTLCLLCVLIGTCVLVTCIYADRALDWMGSRPSRAKPNWAGVEVGMWPMATVVAVVLAVSIVSTPKRVAIPDEPAERPENPQQTGSNALHTSSLGGSNGREALLYQMEHAQRLDTGVDRQNSRVLLVEFGDYLCPVCRLAAGELDKVMNHYQDVAPGEIRVVHRDFPLDRRCNQAIGRSVHEFACEAAIQARIASYAGRLTEMEQWLYLHQEGLNERSIADAAARIGIASAPRLRSRAVDEIARDIEDARTLHITATPTLFINGVEFVGALSSRLLEVAIEHERAAGPIPR